jgi:uncharacterized protein YcaQ
MPRSNEPYGIASDTVVRLWLHRQFLLRPRGRKLTRRAFVEHLERTGGLQLDSVNVLDRAHYLTLWSRFGPYDRALPDRWTYRDRLAYEYRGHQASILPNRHLPLSRRAMRRFDRYDSWWMPRRPPVAVTRRVLGRIRREGPLESADFRNETGSSGPWWGWKDEKMALELLWFQGRLAIHDRRHFRRVYDLSDRVYPDGPVASLTAFEDSWLLTGLSGNGVATEKHLAGYFDTPRLKAPERKKIIARNLRAGRIVEVVVDGGRQPWFARPEDLEGASRLPAPRGTNLICPFDSLLWQRSRAEDLLRFRYRIEAYLPLAKREYGYYVMPILHDGQLVGRLDPKFHRERRELEIRSLRLEPWFDGGSDFDAGVAKSLHDLVAFLGAKRIKLPRPWRRLLG